MISGFRRALAVLATLASGRTHSLSAHGVSPASALNSLPLLALACAATAAMFAAGWRRSALSVLTVLALAMAALAAAALAAPGSSMVRVVATGPTITLIGAIVTIILAVLKGVSPNLWDSLSTPGVQAALQTVITAAAVYFSPPNTAT